MKNRGLLFAVIIFAYAIRIMYPQLYMTGGDMPGHILASMRLHLTSFITINPLYQNFFAQIFQFTHGYTTILVPWLLYEFIFGLFNIPITEINLTYVNSLIGIFSLLSIFWFTKENFNTSIAILSTLIMSIIPVHIGLSRAHAGYLLLYLTFFYCSLSFLHKYITEKKSIWLMGYFVSTSLYIGCDNAFILGLIFQIIYIYLISENLNHSQYIKELKRIYVSPYVILVIIPIGIYILVTIISFQAGIERGYLLRLFGKANSVGLSINPLKVIMWGFSLIGPPVGIFLIAITHSIVSKNHPNRKDWFLLILFSVYALLLMLNNQIEKNYILFLTLPMAIITSKFIISRPIWIFATIICTLIYSLAVVYRIDIGFSTNSNYGSLDYKIGDNDYGIKTLGYLVRSGELKISRGESERDPIGLFLDYEGAQYYIGDNFHDWAAQDIQQGETGKYPNYILAYQIDNNEKNNQAIKDFAIEQNLYVIGKITKKNQVIILLYSNLKTQNQKTYPVEIYNKKFDQDYGNLNSLPKLWLGSF